MIQNLPWMDLFGPIFLPPPKLQRELMQVIDTRIADDLLTSSSPMDKARLPACRAKHSGVWLTVFPSSYMFCLLDTHIGLAMRLRLGLAPQDNLPFHCKCNYPLSTDPNHFLSCKLLRRTIATTRHDDLHHLLCDFTRQAGCAVFIEPRGLDGTGKRPDAQVFFQSGTELLDTSITHPCSPSYFARAATEQLWAAKTRQQAKHNKYDLLAAEEKSPFSAFVMETFGGFGSEALNFIKKISRCHSEQFSTPTPKAAFRSLVTRALSICLQRGNAIIQLHGCRQARVHHGGPLAS